MKSFSRITFPAIVMAIATAGALNLGHEPVEAGIIDFPTAGRDTVIYAQDAYKRHRIGNLEAEEALKDSLLMAAAEEDTVQVQDTTKYIAARDTIRIPDSLRLTDPFRYRYYIALVDSLTHVQVRDSLIAQYRSKLAAGDSLAAFRDSLDWHKVDSIYVADSTAAAKARFQAWYNGLSRKEQKKYDAEQMLPILIHRADSIREAKEEAKAVKDSIREYTPLILETFALNDSLQYKQVIHWTLDPDFQKMEVSRPDTTFNNHFHDYPFLKKDVNATWLGVAGSPLLYYNFFNRKSDEGVEFYDALESWSHSARTIRHYNTKTPYTELSYTGTLFSEDAKTSDNLHLFTTQNFTPGLNFSLLYDRFGGNGMLDNEKTVNNNFAAQLNYLGKRYMGHLGYIRNVVRRGENGGIVDPGWVRDTIVDARDMTTFLKNAESKTTKNTVYLDQQLRIPFTFINKIKARRDSTFKFDADSLDRNITTAFLGHSSDFSVYTRSYSDALGSDLERSFYNDFFKDGLKSKDSLNVTRLDNKVFIKLQPWASDAVVSKLNVGIGDRLEIYFDSTMVRPLKHKENSIYAYAGIEGQIRNAVHWDAKGHFTFAGVKAGDFDVEANARLDVYPFRKARKSPLSLGAHFETSLTAPNYYQQTISLNHFEWNNEFGKTSTTKIQGFLNIPYWLLDVQVGYALLANNLYYDNTGIVRQNDTPMSIFTAALRKEFVLGPVHLDHRLLYQVSSNQSVVPLPQLAANLRYFVQFPVKKGVMEMQIGVDGHWNTKWFAPSYNPNLGVFYNQDKYAYNNGPWFDAFINVQWKRASIFIKYQNVGNGWPMKHADYFSADRYIVTQSGLPGLKIGVFWPFYVNPGKPHSGQSGQSSQSGQSGQTRTGGRLHE